MIDIALILGFVACVVAAAGLALAEVALIRVRRPPVAVAAEHGDRRAAALLVLLDDLPIVVNSVLLVVLLVQVGAATISGALAARWFGGIGVTVASVLVTFVLFVYAEALPKTRAVRRPQEYALRVTPALRTVVRFARPPVTVLVRLANLQSGGDPPFDAASEAELLSLAKESAEAGEIEPGDAVLVERSFRFGDRRVAEVMVGREEIQSVARDDDAPTVLACAVEYGHRRLPVTVQGIDDVVGVVRLRDVAAAARSTAIATAGTLMVPVLRVGPDELIAEVLERMQRQSSWMAMVEEAGETVGLVTIEDIVAELVGEISEDHPADPSSGPDGSPGLGRRG